MSAELTRKMASLASGDPFYFGWYLNNYSEMTGMNKDEMSKEIGCLPSVFDSMSLCRAPYEDPPDFRRDVEAIADRYGARPEAIANIVRSVQVTDGSASLIAARDRDEDDERAPERDE